MATKTITKKTRRIIIDYSQNLELMYVLSELQKYFVGMSKAEIAKLAIIELFQKKNKNLPVVELSKQEEESLAKSIKDSSQKIRLKTDQDIIDFVEKLSA